VARAGVRELSISRVVRAERFFEPLIAPSSTSLSSTGA
jgi:hypothetical protein